MHIASRRWERGFYVKSRKLKRMFLKKKREMTDDGAPAVISDDNDDATAYRR